MAVVDHITQTLPAAEGVYVQPLLVEYVKALLALLSHAPVVETLATYEAVAWTECMDFVLDIIEWHLNLNGSSATPSRGSPAPGTPLTFSLPTSTFPSTATSSSQRAASRVHQTVLHNLLECIQQLVSAANAPLLKRSEAVTSTVLQCIRMRSLGVSSVLHLGFSILNSIVQATQAEDIRHTNTLVAELLPVIRQWWQAKTTSQENALINSIQVEALRLLFNISPNVEHLIQLGDTIFAAELEELCDMLWNEYSHRDGRGQLHQDDITFATDQQHPHAFTLRTFSFRQYNMEGERRWAVIHILGLFEAILWRQSRSQSGPDQEDEEHPRKRRKVGIGSSRLQQKLQMPLGGTRLTALQLVPFFVSHVQMPSSEIAETLSSIISLVSHKNARHSAWAMIASARYVNDFFDPTWFSA